LNGAWEHASKLLGTFAPKVLERLLNSIGSKDSLDLGDMRFDEGDVVMPRSIFWTICAIDQTTNLIDAKLLAVMLNCEEVVASIKRVSNRAGIGRCNDTYIPKCVRVI
jgi:hypothetical protein